MKKSLLIVLLLVISAVFLSRCYLSKFVYTDEEIAEHYSNRKDRPIFKSQPFLDRNIHYAVMGNNDSLPLLVMIHGAPGAWYGYMNLVDDSTLQKHFRIVSVDRLGYGKSGIGNEVLSVQMQALAVKTVIDHENKSGKKVYLLGRSYGAPIAGWLAINYPSMVEKLVMASPVVDPDHEKFYWFSDIGRSSFVQWMLPEMLNVATSEKFSHQREMARMENSWKNLYVPTCVVVGEEDQVADTANYSFATRHLINCPAVFMKVKNTGHQITIRQPELVKSLLLADAPVIHPSSTFSGALISEVCDHRNTEHHLTVAADQRNSVTETLR